MLKGGHVRSVHGERLSFTQRVGLHQAVGVDVWSHGYSRDIDDMKCGIELQVLNAISHLFKLSSQKESGDH